MHHFGLNYPCWIYSGTVSNHQVYGLIRGVRSPIINFSRARSSASFPFLQQIVQRWVLNCRGRTLSTSVFRHDSNSCYALASLHPHPHIPFGLDPVACLSWFALAPYRHRLTTPLSTSSQRICTNIPSPLHDFGLHASVRLFLYSFCAYELFAILRLRLTSDSSTIWFTTHLAL